MGEPRAVGAGAAGEKERGDQDGEAADSEAHEKGRRGVHDIDSEKLLAEGAITATGDLRHLPAFARSFAP